MCGKLDSIQHVQVFLKTRARYRQALLDTGNIPTGTRMPVLISPSGAEPAARVRVSSCL